MLIDALLILAGFVLLVWGSDRFVAGAAATAVKLGVSPLIIGLTIVGFGTSAPEMVISGIAALRDSPGIAVGNALGSNIANMALILGVAGMIKPIVVRSETLKREYPALLIVTVVAIALLADLTLARPEGVFLLMGLIVLTTWMTILGVKGPDVDPMADEYAAEIPADMSTAAALGWLLLGIILLPTASQMLVIGASDIARELGVSDVVIGLTIVAIGTSLPELAAGVASVLKNEPELVLGNVLGSNMFNLLGVLGIAGLISPLDIEPATFWRDCMLVLLLTLAIFLMSFGWGGRAGRISRRDASILLVVFVSYIVYLIVISVGAR